MKTFKQHLKESATDTIHVFDLDDTLFFTKSKIYYTIPGENKERSATTSEFAEIRDKLPKDTQFDYRDFRKFKSIYYGIVGGKPNIPVLKRLDDAVNAGHKIGILTARGNQKAVLAGVKDALLYRNKKGDLMPLPHDQFRKRWVFAISDVATANALGGIADASSPEQLKAVVLQNILGDKEGFKKIIFYDDDAGNIKAVKDLKDPRITTIKV